MKLRKLDGRDAVFMLEWMHDPSVTRYLQNNFMERTRRDCEQFIEDSRKDRNNLHMAVVDDNDIYMGTVSLKHMTCGTGEFAIALRSCAMGKGFSKFGMSEMLRIGLEDLHLEYIYWCVNPLNKRAVRFYDKNGYERINVDEISNQQLKGFYSKEQIATFLWYRKGVS